MSAHGIARTSRLVRAAFALLWAGMGLLSTQGCVTLGRFEELEGRVGKLELERERLKASMAEDVVRLHNLHQKLTEAEQTLRKSGANLGLRMEQLEAAQPKVQGKVDAVAFQLQGALKDVERLKRELFDRLGATSIYLPPDLSKKPDDVWALAQARLKSGDARQARALLDHFEASYPDDKRADDALVALARLLEEGGDVDGAMRSYQRVAEQYPDGDQGSRSLWRIGELLTAKGDCKRAKGIFEYLGRTFPDSAEGRKAKDQAKTVAKTCTDR